jgi:hypothetical protein
MAPPAGAPSSWWGWVTPSTLRRFNDSQIWLGWPIRALAASRDFGGKTDEFLLFGLSVALGYVYPTINHCSLGVGCPANLVPATLSLRGFIFLVLGVVGACEPGLHGGRPRS